MMFGRISNFLPSFRRAQERSDDDETEEEEAGFESPRSEGDYTDCESDIEEVSTPVSLHNQQETKTVPNVQTTSESSIPLQSADFWKIVAPTTGVVALHKNDLQTFCQRGRKKMPVYSHVKEGPGHAPTFRAVVEVDGTAYRSVGEYFSKVDAEQAAAKEALEFLNQGVSNPLHQAQQTSTLASANFSCNDGRDGAVFKDNGKHSQIPGLTMDAASVGSSPPPASSSVCTRSQSASSSRQQLWGVMNNADSNLKGIPPSSLATKKPTASKNGAAPAGIASQIWGIAGKLSGLELDKNSSVPEFANSARKPQIVRWPLQTDHLAALGKLEFSTHAFPLLTRLNGLPLEEVFRVDEVESLQNMPGDEVNLYLWELDFRSKRPTATIHPPPRRPSDPELLLFDCYINSSGKRFVASPNKQGSTTLLQRTLGFDKVLRVFLEGKSPGPFKEMFRTGIFVGNRLYQYFVHKTTDDLFSDEEKKSPEGAVNCYFVCTDSRGERDLQDKGFQRFQSVVQVRTKFMHVHNTVTVAKYVARLQLCLSKTITIHEISFSDLVIKELDDIPSKDPCNPQASFTDGTGFISTDLATLMPTSIFHGTKLDEGQEGDFHEKYPSLLQIRFFHNGVAHKGTLLANKKLAKNTIAFYKSTKKVPFDPSLKGYSISSFELVSASRRPRVARLSQDLIVLLTIGGVEETIFLDAVRDAIAEVHVILRDRQKAHQEVLRWESHDNYPTRKMLEAGIPMEEPALQKNLIELTRNKLINIAKGKVPLAGTFYLMGTADPSNTLEPNEVVIYKDGVSVLGLALVYRAPGKHPGDPHRVQAVHSQALDDCIGGEKNAIFFSTQGSRPIPHEIAKGDLDGDNYWICTNQKVLDQFKESLSRWNPSDLKLKPGNGQRSVVKLTPTDLEDALAEEYFNERFDKSGVVGIASYRWLTHVDGFLNPDVSPKDKEIHKEEFLKYPDYIYEGVDTKSGTQLCLPPEHGILKRYKAPYLLKKPDSKVEGGNSILGKIYKLGQPAEHVIGSVEVDPAFYIQGSDNYLDSWTERFSIYRKEMSKARSAKDPEEMQRIIMRYRMLLYGAPSFKKREKGTDTVLAEASAIYHVVYKKAKRDLTFGDTPRLSFAWNVAAAALSFIYEEGQPGESSHFSESAYNEIHKKSKY